MLCSCFSSGAINIILLDMPSGGANIPAPVPEPPNAAPVEDI